VAGKEVSIKSDIYALGLVMYEMFTGKRAFEADNLADLIRMRGESRPTEISSTARDVDPAVERIILKCLDPDPAKRPSGALAVSAALPGGDPLAAALAAGETPSPEMVAAAGAQEGLKPALAITCLGVARSGDAARKSACATNTVIRCAVTAWGLTAWLGARERNWRRARWLPAAWIRLRMSADP
jgi:hypothetical protein